MLDNATLSQLHDLSLTTTAACFREQLELRSQDSGGIASLSFEARFNLLVEAEWLNHQNKRTERQVRQARFLFPLPLRI